MKNLANFLVLIVLTAAVALVTYLLLGGPSPDAGRGTSEARRPPREATREAEERSLRTSRRERARSRPDEAASPREAEVVPPERQGVGALEVVARDETGAPVEGSRPRLLQAASAGGALPAMEEVPARLVSLSDGRARLEDVPAGNYLLEVHAPEHLPARVHAVAVREGSRQQRAVVLARGVRPAGRIVEEVGSAGIPDVKVVFADGTRLVTGPDGRFDCPRLLPLRALQGIAFEHPDYDRTRAAPMPGQDPRDLVFALTSGDHEIQGRIVNRSGRLAPRLYHLELWRRLGGRNFELRRTVSVPAAARFTLRNIHRGSYRLGVAFPDRPYATRFFDVPFLPGAPPVIPVELNLDRGVPLRGRLRARAASVSGRRVELRDPQTGIVAAVMTSDAEGAFGLDDIGAGTWQLRVSMGGPLFETARFEAAGAPVELEVDCDARRLLPAGSRRGG